MKKNLSKINSEKMYEFIINSSDDAIMSKDLNGVITSWNLGSEKLFGYTSKETIGKKMPVMFPSERKNEEQDLLDKISNGELVDHFETVRIKKDGSKVEISVSMSPMYDDEGNIVGASKIARDISSLKEMHQKSKYFESIVNSSDDAIMSKSMDGIITSWNPGAEKLFGYTEKEAVGQPMLMLFPEDRKNEEKGILEKLSKGQAIDHFETVRIKKDGSEVEISVTISPIRNASGKVVGASKIARDIGEAKAIQKQSEYFQSIIHSSDDAIMSKDLNGVITSWNLGSEKLFGYTSKETVGKKMPVMFPSERKNEEQDLLDRLAKGESVDHFETIRIKKDGSKVDISVSMSPMYDDEGNIVGASKIARDITQLKKAEKLLAQNNENLYKQKWLQDGIVFFHDSVRGDNELHELCQSMVTAVAKYIDAKIGVIYLEENNHLEWQAGYAYPRKKENKNSIEFGEGIVGQAAAEKAIQYINIVCNDEFLITSSIIKSVPKEIVAVPLLFDNEVIAVVEFGTLNEFSELHRQFLDKVSITMSIVLNAAQANDKVQLLLQETQAQSEELIVQQEELKASNEELEEKTNILIESENELKTQSEELQATNEELEEKSSYLEEKKQEVENKNLEIEVAKEELEKKAKALEKTGAYKSEFLANMSHELRTPLNSLLILSKSLADNDDGNLTEDQVEECTIIHSGGQELLALINDILDLSKVEAGKMELLLEAVKIEDIVNNLQMQFNPVAKQNALAFEIEISTDLPQVLKLDEQKICQVLKNLLSNAFKFTKSGLVSLRIHKPNPQQEFRLDSLSPENSISFSVVDTGVGIPKDKQEHIFEAFKQVDGSTSREYGGTGLGLTISRQLALLMGGEIQLKSQENIGTTFTLYIPIKPESNIVTNTDEKQKIKDIDLQLEANSQSLVDMDDIPVWINDDRNDIEQDSNKLLIIEDDLEFAKILLKEGRAQGFVCFVAGDGKTGLDLAFRYKPNAILLDLGLPGITGREVLKELKHNETTRKVPVHIISAEDENNELIENGAIGFLQKPAAKSDLNDVFKKFENVSEKMIKNILVVEDDLSSQVAIKKLIQKDNIEIIFVDNGKGACEKIINNDIDCVVLDLNLPDMSGFELLQLISSKKIELPPVVVYTGKSLTSAEYDKLRNFTASIVVKGADSPERLLDEVSLFLHSVDNNSPKMNHSEIDNLLSDKKPLEGCHVLLVDDDMRNLFALSKVLKKNGLIVEIAKDGQFALNVLAENSKIELVIMDIMMPVMDGYTAIKKIRSQEKYKKLPIIALTAKAMPEDRQKCIDVGASDYLSKPVDVDGLISLMVVWIGTD